MLCGFIVDPLESFHPDKDSTMLLMQTALQRGYRVWYWYQNSMAVDADEISAEVGEISAVDFDTSPWFQQQALGRQTLLQCQLIMMRKDPPVDAQYLYTTHLLSLLELKGVRVVNRPQALRDYNEKLALLHFPDLAPPTMVSAQPQLLRQFLQQQQDIIVKPLDGMGGASIYRLRTDDPNITVILENISQNGQRSVMAQRYLAQVKDGDYRVFIIDGQPLDYVIARIPQAGETRANLAAGGRAEVRPLSPHQRMLALKVGALTQREGIVIVGLDVIGDCVTEINVTCPTGMRQVQRATGLNVAEVIYRALEG